MNAKKEKRIIRADRHLTLTEAIQAGDARTAKAELKHRTQAMQDAPLEELAYLYADSVREILVSAEKAQKQPTLQHLLFPNASTVRLYLDLLVDDLCNQVRQAGQEGSVESEILAFVDENIFSPELSLSMVAERFEQQKSFVSALYKREKGTNYVDYVNRIRVIQAAELLKDADADVSLDSISHAVGYISQSTFRRNFTKYKGYTPSRYRRLFSV